MSAGARYLEPTPPRRVALVGLGRMGRHHLRVLRETPGLEVVALVDSTAAPPADAGGAHFCRSVAELRSIAFDAAVIATPTETHYEVSLELIAMGKDLLIEKPLASSYEQGKRVLSMAQRQGTRLVVGHVERFNPAVRKLREVIREGLLGTPMHFAFTRVGGYPEPVVAGNNVILDLAVHDIDVLRSLTGPLKLEHSRCHVSGRDGVFDAAEIFLASGSGCTATVHVNWITPTKIRSIRVTGTRGVCFCDYVSQTCELFGGSLAGAVEAGDAGCGMQDVRGAAERVQFAVPKVEPLRAQAEHFRALLTTGDGGEICMGNDALAAVLLAERALDAGRRRIRPFAARAEASEQAAVGRRSPDADGPFATDDWV